MYESFTQSFSVVHQDFVTTDTAPSVVENTNINAYSGVLVRSDPSGLFTPFSFDSDGCVDVKGDIISEINKQDVNTNKQLKTLLNKYSSNELIEILYKDSETGELTDISVRITEDGFVEVDEKEERKYFGNKSEDVEIDIDDTSTEWTRRQQLIRIIVLVLFTLLLLALLSGAILQIISIVLETTEVTDLISNLT